MRQKQKVYIVKITDNIGILKYTWSDTRVFKDKQRMLRALQGIKRFIMHKFSSNVQRDSYDKHAIYTYDVSETEDSLDIAEHEWTLRDDFYDDFYDRFHREIEDEYDIREVLDNMVDNPKFDISKISDRSRIMNMSTQHLTLKVYTCKGFV